MSRVAKLPIALPKGVEVSIAAGAITVKGPKGTLSQSAVAGVNVVLDNGALAISPVTADSDALAGTMRALLANMVYGVSTGFERKLELVGVGYRATMQGKDLGLALGYSHPIEIGRAHV